MDLKPFDYIIEVPDGRGGPGRGQGRKPVKDKKRQVYIMVLQSVIDQLGGEDKVKQILEAAVSNKQAELEFISNTGERDKAA